jgi:hypothetical protein
MHESVRPTPPSSTPGGKSEYVGIRTSKTSATTGSINDSTSNLPSLNKKNPTSNNSGNSQEKGIKTIRPKTAMSKKPIAVAAESNDRPKTPAGGDKSRNVRIREPSYRWEITMNTKSVDKINPAEENNGKWAHRSYLSTYPCANLLLQKKWDSYAKEDHSLKIAKVKPSIDNSPPKKYSHLVSQSRKKRAMLGMYIIFTYPPESSKVIL